jgi:hypothetical protein
VLLLPYIAVHGAMLITQYGELIRRIAQISRKDLTDSRFFFPVIDHFLTSVAPIHLPDERCCSLGYLGLALIVGLGMAIVADDFSERHLGCTGSAHEEFDEDAFSSILQQVSKRDDGDITAMRESRDEFLLQMLTDEAGAASPLRSLAKPVTKAPSPTSRNSRVSVWQLACYVVHVLPVQDAGVTQRK